jgi:hypothetical protein
MRDMAIVIENERAIKGVRVNQKNEKDAKGKNSCITQVPRWDIGLLLGRVFIVAGSVCFTIPRSDALTLFTWHIC